MKTPTRWIVTVLLAVGTMLSGCAMTPRQQERCERLQDDSAEVLVAATVVTLYAGLVVLAVCDHGGGGGCHGGHR